MKQLCIPKEINSNTMRIQFNLEKDQFSKIPKTPDFLELFLLRYVPILTNTKLKNKTTGH